MSDLEKTLEIERAVNLLMAFNWKKSGEVVEGDQVTLSFTKTILGDGQETPPEEPAA